MHIDYILCVSSRAALPKSWLVHVVYQRKYENSDENGETKVVAPGENIIRMKIGEKLQIGCTYDNPADAPRLKLVQQMELRGTFFVKSDLWMEFEMNTVFRNFC